MNSHAMYAIAYPLTHLKPHSFGSRLRYGKDQCFHSSFYPLTLAIKWCTHFDLRIQWQMVTVQQILGGFWITRQPDSRGPVTCPSPARHLPVLPVPARWRWFVPHDVTELFGQCQCRMSRPAPWASHMPLRNINLMACFWSGDVIFFGLL